MDNLEQIEEIRKYNRYLFKTFGVHLDSETAAKLWILKYAALWRNIKKRTQKKPTHIGNY